jgi:hypothetical protein
MKIVITKITDENKDELLIMALSAYLGESCKYCGKKMNTLADLKDVVYAGYHSKGRIACQSCWDVNNEKVTK